MTPPAADRYEIATESLSGPRSQLRSVFGFVLNLFARDGGAREPGSMIVSVRDRQSGSEVFRHIEDLGEDEGHMLADLERDLAEMTAEEFQARWVD